MIWIQIKIVWVILDWHQWNLWIAADSEFNSGFFFLCRLKLHQRRKLGIPYCIEILQDTMWKSAKIRAECGFKPAEVGLQANKWGGTCGHLIQPTYVSSNMLGWTLISRELFLVLIPSSHSEFIPWKVFSLGSGICIPQIELCKPGFRL